MSNFTNLQNDFKERMNQFEQLHTALSINLVKRDLARVQEHGEKRIEPVNDKLFALDDYVTLELCDDGTIEIEDDRGTPFRWIFEIKLRNEGAECGSLFKYGNYYYKVEDLTEAQGRLFSQEVEVMLQKVEKAVEILQNSPNLEAWAYDYYDAHENVTCPSLEKVIETVLAHSV